MASSHLITPRGVSAPCHLILTLDPSLGQTAKGHLVVARLIECHEFLSTARLSVEEEEFEEKELVAPSSADSGGFITAM